MAQLAAAEQVFLVVQLPLLALGLALFRVPAAHLLFSILLPLRRPFQLATLRILLLVHSAPCLILFLLMHHRLFECQHGEALVISFLRLLVANYLPDDLEETKLLLPV